MSPNTCAECRFWKDLDLEHRAFYGVVATRTYSGNVKECSRVREDDNRAFIIAQGSDDDALMTRSDFGCVQFEQKAADLTGIPVSEKPVVTSRNLRRTDSAF